MTVTPQLFGKSSRDRIAAAVKDAEAGTSGEIVPFIVERSDAYEEAMWHGGLLAALLVLVGAVLVKALSGFWWSMDTATLALATLLGSVVGMFSAAFIPSLQRLLAGRAMMDRRVAGRAAEAFLSEEVFRTRDRTGILIFVSLLEREVLVLGDTGINAKVRQEEWDAVVRAVVSGLRSRDATEGLVEGIRLAGVLLRKHGFAARPDDVNELPNLPRSGTHEGLP